MQFRRLFRITLILSLLLHLGLSLSVYLTKNTERDRADLIDVSLLPADTPDRAKQIVQQNNKPVNDETDKNAKYLGQFNQRVVEETKASRSGDFVNRADLRDHEDTKKRPREKQSKLKQALSFPKTASGLPMLEALKPTFDWDKLDKTGGSRRETASKTDDYLKNVKEGAQTMLSTREFLYYSYYNRIRGQLKQYWEPKIKDKVKKIFAQGRNLASDEDRVTKVLIVLNGQGTLVKVQVVGESGVHDLDDAAVEAFRQAAPFPNPPKGIVGPDGLIKIRWDFILEA
jgi:protein TonB